MSPHPEPDFLHDQRGLTGAERALLVCFGLAVVILAGVLVRRGSEKAASDAERTLKEGSGPVSAFAQAGALGGGRLLHAAGDSPRPPAEPPRPAAFALAAVAPARSAGGPPEAPRAFAVATVGAPAPAAPAPEAPAPVGGLTVGDTAGVKRTFTDAVYRRNLTLSSQAKIALPDAAMKGELAAFLKVWEKNKARYEAVSQKTGIPAKLIAALHFRESSGNFNTYLHQGDPLGRPARHVPRNIPVFHKWEDAAVHALNMKSRIRDDLGLGAGSTDIAAMATYAEHYNGLGYYNKGRVSPYVYSGTDRYQKGKYVGDGVYDPNVRDKQLGVLTMIEAISSGVSPAPVIAAPAPAPAPPAGAPAPPAPAPAPAPAPRPRRRPRAQRRRSASSSARM